MKGQMLALYLRLSDEEDGGPLGESGSISSQREILMDYIGSHREFSGFAAAEFCDDGYSGTDFRRPQIQRLFALARQGEVACIFVKDLSRFGRNHIEVGNYLEQVFPFLGVRFIAVNDGYDSAADAQGGELVQAAFKNLAYDLYSKDLSEKITSVRRMKAAQGKFIAAFAPYGYRKSPGQGLVADGEAALVVRRIFLMAAQGVPKAQIARTLNQEGVLAPAMRKRQQGERFYTRQAGEASVWSGSTVWRILKDERYMGDGVYGRVRPQAAGSRTCRPVPREGWLVMPDSHEPVVSRELFQQANASIKKYPKYQRKGPGLFSGMVRCQVCGHRISNKGSRYKCRLPQQAGQYACYGEAIREEWLAEAVLAFLQRAGALLAYGEAGGRQKAAGQEKARQIRRELSQNQRKAQRLGHIRLKKYEEYKKGGISKEQFLKIKEGLEEEKAILEKEKIALEEEKAALGEGEGAGEEKAALGDEEGAMEKKEAAPQRQERRRQGEWPDAGAEARDSWPFTRLTREMAQAMVKEVVVLADGAIRIDWRFQDIWFVALTAIS